MNHCIIEYLSTALEQLHFTLIPECSTEYELVYKMLSNYGKGKLRKIDFNGLFMILIAEFIPKENFEKVSTVKQEYFEISQFETDSSFYKVGGRKIKHVEKGIFCYANTSKTVHVSCEAGKLTRFTKIIFTTDYFDTFLKEQYGDSYNLSKDAMDFLVRNPNSSELNFVFQQIRDCQAVGSSKRLYLESKVMEILSLVTHNLEQEKNKLHLPVKLDKKDIRSLGKVITFMKKDLSAYPSIAELSKVANMSKSRFQMAFRQTYGTTVYEYLKEIRINYALLLLQDSDYSIGTISAKVGYNNAGHFAGIFKKTFGINPSQYRNIHRIK